MISKSLRKPKTRTGKESNAPYLQGHTHGGDFDPNEGTNKPTDSWRTAPTHGGDYDPNQFDPSHLSGQSRGQQYDSPAMASNALQQASSDQDTFYDLGPVTSSGNPAGSHFSPSSIPLVAVEHRPMDSSSQLNSHGSSQTPWGSSNTSDDTRLLFPSNADSQWVGPMSSQRDLLINVDQLSAVGEYDEHDGTHRQVKHKPPDIFYHRDFLKRPYRGTRGDRFLNPKNGRLTKLIVQCNSGVLKSRSEDSWTRKVIRNNSRWLFRVSYWATSTGAIGAIAKWLPACLALTFLLLNPFPVTTKVQNNGFFEPFLYRDWQYSYDARNEFENPPEGRDGTRSRTPANERSAGRPLVGKMERTSEPEYLYLADGMKRINVQNWREEHGKEAKLEYVLVSYTGSQFKTAESWRYLHLVGQHAARTAKVEAYWVGCSCLGSKEEVEQNVWRICDVVRGAFSIVVAVAGSVGSPDPEGLPYHLLRDWGSRVWTLPELLLSPERDDIVVYTNLKLDSSFQIHRRNFARYWDDSSLVGQLIDHYEGSVILSPLELMTIALRCLQNRHTTEYLPGDLSYALMGLLRQRPNVCHTDSAFQAFARLSLANDSNMLLERLVCLLPHNPYDSWHSLHDHWNASLWDIYPRIQVCGIGVNDSVTLDGARAANIRWKSFPRVMLRHNDTKKRRLARIVLTLVSPLLLLGILILLSIIDGATPISGLILITLAAFTISLSRQLIRKLYLDGKIWWAQPWFIGMEGYMSLPDIERHLFGGDLGRLSWSATGSSLSRHKVEDSQDFENYCQGQDPSTYPDINARIKQAQNSTGGEERIFTLVNTGTMTVTLFSAVRPPVAVLACGEEGGMQRALLCSYEWTNNTLYRETVLRMETQVFWKMSPVGRVRLSLRTRGHLDV